MGAPSPARILVRFVVPVVSWERWGRISRWVGSIALIGVLVRTSFDAVYYFGITEFRFPTAGEVNATSLPVLLPVDARNIVVAKCMDTGEEWARFDFSRGRLPAGLPGAGAAVAGSRLELPNRTGPHWWWDDWWPDRWLKEALRSPTSSEVQHHRWSYEYWERPRLAQAILDLETGTAFVWTRDVTEPWLLDASVGTSTDSTGTPQGARWDASGALER